MEVITVLGIHQARYAVWGGARMTRAHKGCQAWWLILWLHWRMKETLLEIHAIESPMSPRAAAEDGNG